MSVVLLWDIDGTLLSTARAGVGALEDACEVVLGQRFDLQGMTTAGLTDPEIATAVIRRSRASHDVLRAFLDAYVTRLPGRLSDRRGGVLPNVEDILQAVDSHPDATNALLTGNMRQGARAKLEHYGLARFFAEPMAGAFGDDALKRNDIAGVALKRLQEMGVAADELVVIGDTPADVRCGLAHGMRTVAVATGTYSEAELSSAGAWWVVPQLPAVEEFLRKLGVS